jgi:glycosyltransferase involved in cell wall biosynthesis
MPHESSLPRFSLVIPAYNEERFLPPLLDSVEAAARVYAQSGSTVEVIVADNASTDGTAEVARSRGCVVVPVAKRSIAAARNAGAAAARGKIVGFVDADMQLHPDTFDAIERALASPRIVGGATGIVPDRWSLGLVATFLVFLPFAWISRFDSGVVFCRRQDFVATGGYDESLRVAEDVAFLLALRRLGRKQGKRLTRLKGVKAIASTRKFDEHGEWHYLTKLPSMALGLALKRPSTLREVEAVLVRAAALTVPKIKRAPALFAGPEPRNVSVLVAWGLPRQQVRRYEDATSTELIHRLFNGSPPSSGVKLL